MLQRKPVLSAAIRRDGCYLVLLPAEYGRPERAAYVRPWQLGERCEKMYGPGRLEDDGDTVWWNLAPVGDGI